MTDNKPSDSEDDWIVTVSVHQREGQTRATARLQFGDYESVGVGLCRLSPGEHGFAGVGAELAVAHALSDLAHKLTVPAHHDVVAVSQPSATPAAL
jgi:uncharacterized protein DUF1876